MDEELYDQILDIAEDSWYDDVEIVKQPDGDYIVYIQQVSKYEILVTAEQIKKLLNKEL